MKTFTLSILFACSISLSFSQRASLGIALGINFNELQIDQDLSLSNQIKSLTTESKPGFHLGIQSLIKVSNRLKLSPQLLIGFSELALEIDYNSDQKNKISIEQVYIRVPLDLQLDIIKGKNALYLLSGLEYATNISDGERDGLLSIKDDFWSARFGFGLRKDFNRFSMSPELSFVKSFSNIENDNTLVLNQVITNLDHSILNLSIKFQGLLGD